MAIAAPIAVYAGSADQLWVWTTGILLVLGVAVYRYRAVGRDPSGCFVGYALSPLAGPVICAIAGVLTWLREFKLRFASPRQVAAGAVVGLISGAIASYAVPAATRGFRAYQSPFSAVEQLIRNPALLVGAVVAISAVNAVAEEWLFRHQILGGLVHHGCPPRIAITMSSLSFGFAHLPAGLPGGLIGLVLTTSFGVVVGLGYVRLPDPRWFILGAHFAADVVIVSSHLSFAS